MRIEAQGEVVDRDVAGQLAKARRVVQRGQRVQVGDEVERILGAPRLLLQLDVLLDGAVIVAEVKGAGGLNS